MTDNYDILGDLLNTVNTIVTVVYYYSYKIDKTIQRSARFVLKINNGNKSLHTEYCFANMKLSGKPIKEGCQNGEDLSFLV